MLNKKDFLKYASTLAFPIMLQNLIGTLVNIADTVMLGYVSQTATIFGQALEAEVAHPVAGVVLVEAPCGVPDPLVGVGQ